LEGVAEDLFGDGVRVDVGGVEGGDSRVEGGMHALRGGVVLHLRTVREPVAVGDLGDLESAVSQISVLHDLSLCLGGGGWNPTAAAGLAGMAGASGGRVWPRHGLSQEALFQNSASQLKACRGRQDALRGLWSRMLAESP